MPFCKLYVQLSSTKVGHSSDFTSSRSITLTLSNHRPKNDRRSRASMFPRRYRIQVSENRHWQIKIGGCGDFENFMGPVMSVAWSCFCLDGSDGLSQRAASISQDHGICCEGEGKRW